MNGLAEKTEYQRGFEAGLELGTERGLRLASQKLYEYAEKLTKDRRKERAALESVLENKEKKQI